VALDVVAALSATTTLPLSSQDGPFALASAEICVPGGLSADASNYWVFTIVDTTSSTTLATYSTQTSAQGAITSNVLTSIPVASPASGLSGDALAVVCTKHGSAANLPAQTRFVAHVTKG
jgi:hypothetical protein